MARSHVRDWASWLNAKMALRFVRSPALFFLATRRGGYFTMPVSRWMAFEGEDKSYKALDDRLIDGPLVALRTASAGGGSVTG